ncbi:hypothetical protein PBI_THONKO_10 [Mycobacterium phage Thonko]|uniref:Uncharacterized protein n=1 Tax=Mycobacterium phage Thonko TaxID=2282910 RepID=A0A346FC57_9CAUD|nr:hypothetical protein I5G57_gp010 [Mycobacterium phage Thonko]AXN53282.1 hypothetical protein PBI_THONKO_10 [Mycobacterium phage Thonko]
MIYILLGIVAIVLANVLLVPHWLYLLLVIGGAVLILYGLYLLFTGYRPGPPGAPPRARRVWY